MSEDPETVLTTVLGSCIAVCLFDRDRAIGGMNHFLLPSREGAAVANVRYGAYAMEMLINGLLKDGARRARLEAKIFGGAMMLGGMRDIGAANIDFTRGFLADEGIPVTAESVGGSRARRVRFWAATGQAKQLLVSASEEITPVEARKLVATPQDITLF